MYTYFTKNHQTYGFFGKFLIFQNFQLFRIFFGKNLLAKNRETFCKIITYFYLTTIEISKAKKFFSH